MCEDESERQQSTGVASATDKLLLFSHKINSATLRDIIRQDNDPRREFQSEQEMKDNKGEPETYCTTPSRTTQGPR